MLGCLNYGRSPLWIVAVTEDDSNAVLIPPFECLKWQSPCMQDLAFLLIENADETCVDMYASVCWKGGGNSLSRLEALELCFSIR